MQRPKEFLLGLEHLFIQPIYKNSELPPLIASSEPWQQSLATPLLRIDH